MALRDTGVLSTELESAQLDAGVDQETVEAGEAEIQLNLVEVVEKSEGIRFLGINLKKEVSRINLMSFYLLTFLVCLVIYIKTSITPYLLVSDYGVSLHDSGKIAGMIGLYSTFCVLPGEFLFGALMDVTGRKIPVIVGLIITGVVLILMT